jgi:hypothetical protein
MAGKRIKLGESDAIEEVDGAVEEPEGSGAGRKQQRYKKGSRHGSK